MRENKTVTMTRSGSIVFTFRVQCCVVLLQVQGIVSQEGEGGGFQMLTIAYGGGGSRPCLRKQNNHKFGCQKAQNLGTKTDEHH